MSNAPVWEDGTWTPLPVLDTSIDADVCVIGLGGSGLACIQRSLALDQRVVGLDAGCVGGGAAGRNGGFLLAGLPGFYHHVAVRLGRERVRAVYRRTMAELDRIAVEMPEAIRRTGSLRIAADPAEFADCRAQYQMMSSDGLPVEMYDGPEGQGLLIPTDGAFNPLLRCRLLARRVTSAGASLFEQSRALEISGDRVRTDAGEVRCRRVIVAVDGGLELVLPELASRVRSARLQMLATAPATDVDLPRPVYRRWGYDYWQQFPDRRIGLGGVRDRFVDCEWTTSTEPTDQVQQELDRLLRDQVHTTAPVTHRWAAIVGYSISGLPVIDEARPSVWAIGGYSGTGNVLGALCGRGVAELAICGQSEMLAELREA